MHLKLFSTLYIIDTLLLRFDTDLNIRGKTYVLTQGFLLAGLAERKRALAQT